MEWTNEILNYAVELAEKGYSAAQIGKELGTTRNAVLGALFRAKITIERPPRTSAPKPPKPPKPEFREMRARQPFSGDRGGVYPVDFKVMCVAHVLMARGDYKAVKDRALKGFGYRPASALLGVNQMSLRNWVNDPRYSSRAKALADEMRAVRVGCAELMKATEILALEQLDRNRREHNAAVLKEFSGRLRYIGERVADGENAAEIARSVGVTRERIRQIVQPLLAPGLDTTHIIEGGWKFNAACAERYAIRPVKPLTLPKEKRPLGRPRKNPPREHSGWSVEQRAAAAERMRQRQASGIMRRKPKAQREWLWI